MSNNGRLMSGTHSGSLITRVPVHYLKWAVINDTQEKMVWSENGMLPLATVAEAELKRRGVYVHGAEISIHAIDRFSSLFIHTYIRSRTKDEGLVQFLERTVVELIGEGETVKYGIKFIIRVDSAVPILKTVYGAK